MTHAGIDLGTSTLIVTASDSSGNPRVLANDEGDLFTPTVVYFESPESILVGTEAKHLGVLHPDRCVQNWKRSVGDPAQPVLYEDKNGKQYRAQDIAQILLEYSARVYQGRTGEILARAAVTVPANFTDVQKQEILAAGKAAGLDPFLTPHEPTAATVQSLQGRSVPESKLLVLDFGGGTFDVSVCRTAGTTTEILGTNGVPSLGGVDFSERLLEHVLDAFEEQLGFRLTREDHPVEFQELHSRVEQAKISLSKRDDATVLLTHSGRVLSHVVTRVGFAEMTKDLLQQAMECARSTLVECGLTIDDISEIVPVGGASKMSVFRSAIEEEFGRPASSHTDALFAVGLGAFTLGRLHREAEGHAFEYDGRRLPPLDAYVRDVTAHPIGIATSDGKDRLRNSILLEKGQPLPSDHSQPYRLGNPGQTGALIQVLQGADGALVEECTELGRFELSGLKPIYDDPHRIDIRIHIDSNGILHAEAECRHSNVREKLRITQDVTARSRAA